MSVGDFVSIVYTNNITYTGKVLVINNTLVTLIDEKGNVFAIWRDNIASYTCIQNTDSQ